MTSVLPHRLIQRGDVRLLTGVADVLEALAGPTGAPATQDRANTI